MVAIRERIGRWIMGSAAEDEAQKYSTVETRVDDSPGWRALTGTPHDYDPSKVQEIYCDALEAWRKNPIAWRIVAITTDYVVADDIRISSQQPVLNQFVHDFWHHPKNQMPLRLESICDELSRAGDLFVLLFRNPLDGMSYIRGRRKWRTMKRPMMGRAVNGCITLRQARKRRRQSCCIMRSTDHWARCWARVI